MIYYNNEKAQKFQKSGPMGTRKYFISRGGYDFKTPGEWQQYQNILKYFGKDIPESWTAKDVMEDHYETLARQNAEVEANRPKEQPPEIVVEEKRKGPARGEGNFFTRDGYGFKNPGEWYTYQQELKYGDVPEGASARDVMENYYKVLDERAAAKEGRNITADDVIDGMNRRREKSAYDREIDSLSMTDLPPRNSPGSLVASDSISITSPRDSVPTVRRDSISGEGSAALDSIPTVRRDSISGEGAAVRDSVPSVRRDSISGEGLAVRDSIPVVSRDSISGEGAAVRDSIAGNQGRDIAIDSISGEGSAGNSVVTDSIPSEKRIDSIISSADKSAVAKPKGASNTTPEVVVEPNKGGEGGAKGDGKGSDTETISTEGYNTKGIDGAVTIKILGNKKYDKKLKQEMLDVARWQTRRAKKYQLTVDGMWGTKTQAAYTAEEEKKKAKEGPAVDVGDMNEVVTDEDITRAAKKPEYMYTDKMGRQYDYAKGGIIYQKGGTIARPEWLNPTGPWADAARRVDQTTSAASAGIGRRPNGMELPHLRRAQPVRRPGYTPDREEQSRKIQEWQRKLRVRQDGMWGPKTEGAYQRMQRTPPEGGILWRGPAPAISPDENPLQLMGNKI